MSHDSLPPYNLSGVSGETSVVNSTVTSEAGYGSMPVNPYSASRKENSLQSGDVTSNCLQEGKENDGIGHPNSSVSCSFARYSSEAIIDTPPHSSESNRSSPIVSNSVPSPIEHKPSMEDLEYRHTGHHSSSMIASSVPMVGINEASYHPNHHFQESSLYYPHISPQIASQSATEFVYGTSHTPLDSTDTNAFAAQHRAAINSNSAIASRLLSSGTDKLFVASNLQRQSNNGINHMSTETGLSRAEYFNGQVDHCRNPLDQRYPSFFSHADNQTPLSSYQNYLQRSQSENFDTRSSRSRCGNAKAKDNLPNNFSDEDLIQMSVRELNRHLRGKR